MQKEKLPVYGKRNHSYAYAVHFDSFNPDDYIIVDIRHKQDYESRHFLNAIHVGDYEELLNIIESNADKKVLLQCYSGHTVSLIGNDLVLKGYKNIYFLDEVFEDFWDDNKGE